MNASAKIATHRPARLSHPLCGSDLQTLINALVAGGGVSASKLPQATLATLSAVARWPFSAAERIHVRQLRRHIGPMPAPIFVVGHWRSGTTHLYNLLSCGAFGTVSPFAAGLPWNLLGLGTVLRPWLSRSLPEDRYIDSMPVNPESPQEDELAIANMTRLSFYHGIYFPRHFIEAFNKGVFLDGAMEHEVVEWQHRMRHLLYKVWLDQDQRPVMVKNPVYTARIPMLREMFPQAKFIHVYRNPYEVFFSMRNFFARLFEQFALQPFDNVDVDAVIFDTYERMMTKLIDVSSVLPEDTFVELSYENLIENPLTELEHIYDTLGLGGFAPTRPRFEAYLRSISSYQRNSYAARADDVTKIDRRWHSYIDHWGYRRRRALHETACAPLLADAKPA
jgi:hypothetical protein